MLLSLIVSTKHRTHGVSAPSHFKLGALERVQLNLDAFYHDAHIDPHKKGYLTVTVSVGDRRLATVRSP